MFLQFAIGGAIVPFLVLFFEDRGLGVTQISRIFAGASAMALFFPFFWGMLADRFIPLNRLFIVLNVLVIASLWLLSTQTTFAGLLICFMLFYACYNPSLMLMNPLCFHHLTNPREEFGRLRAWGSLGWMIPSFGIYVWMVAGSVESFDFTLPLGMLLAGVMLACSGTLPHTPTGVVHVGPQHKPGAAYLADLKQLMRSRGYLVILLVYFLVASSFAIQAIYSPALLAEQGLAREWIGISQCPGVILEIILFRWRSLFLNRLSHTNTILLGCGAMLLRHVIFAFSDSLGWLIASHLLTGMVIVFHHIGVSVLVNSIAGPAVRATAQTLLVLCGSGLGPMAANWCVGAISDATGDNLRMVFLFAATLALLGGILLLTQRRAVDQSIESRSVEV